MVNIIELIIMLSLLGVLLIKGLSIKHIADVISPSSI
jgi:hypothetical protein